MTATQPKWKTILFWIVSALLGAMFVFGGAAKLFGSQMHVEAFARWGLPDWTRPVVGLVEVVAGLLIVFPRTRFYGAAGLAATMVGAALTHLVSGVDLGTVPMNAVLFALAATVAWAHRPAFARAAIAEHATV